MKNPPEYLTLEEVEILLDLPDEKTALGLRDKTILELMYSCGLRISEVTGLDTAKIDFSERCILVLGKGNKERFVPIGARVQRVVWKYLQKYRPQPANPLCPAVFLTHLGNPLTTDRLRYIIEKNTRKIGIEGIRRSPHTLRHTFAISYLRNGGDVFSLQRILGHSSLEIVRIYVNMGQADIKDCHRRFSPADNLASKQ